MKNSKKPIAGNTETQPTSENAWSAFVSGKSCTCGNIIIFASDSTIYTCPCGQVWEFVLVQKTEPAYERYGKVSSPEGLD